MPSTPKEQNRGRALISRASILILAGFLIGYSSAQSLGREFQVQVLMCAVIGLISFVGLYFVSVRRADEAAKKAYELELQRMQQLIDRYVGDLTQTVRSRVGAVSADAVEAASKDPEAQT